MVTARKILTLATEQDAQDMAAAIFARRKADLLAQGFAAVDCYLDGRPCPVQTTTSHASSPPPVLDIDPVTGEPRRDLRTGAFIVLTPSDPKALLIDDVAEAMHGVAITIPGGKLVTIDVAAAVPIGAVVDAGGKPLVDGAGKVLVR